MKVAGFRPTRDTFISLLYAAAKNGDLKGANMIVGEMDELKVPFDTNTYNILLSCFAKANRYDNPELQESTIQKAEILFSQLETMHEQNMKDAKEHGSDILVLPHNDLLSVPSVRRQLRGRGGYFVMKEQTLNTFVDIYVEARQPQIAYEKAVALFKKYGFEMDEATYAILIKGFSRAMDMKTAEDLIGQMKSKGIAPTVHALEWMCKGYTRINYLKASMEVLKEMVEKKMPLSKSLMKRLKFAYKDSREYTAALKAIQRMDMFSQPEHKIITHVMEGTLTPEDKEKARKWYGENTVIVPPPVNIKVIEARKRRLEKLGKVDVEKMLEENIVRKARFTSSPISPSGNV
eukprot:TRINITY_DN12227_c0_g2_i1.p1 TRINITY_DN12227_c0_g2~~TRINITY_DN12227_c0_g2_i1.p1  ORF type:complete len:348 (-),score=103.12 TRINITY_DN12227_c0_g2_i1:36-1079(-)